MMRQGCRAAALAAAIALAAGPGAAAPDSGAYLAGLSAGQANDYEIAAEYFLEALQADPGNPSLVESALSALVARGDVARAAQVAAGLDAPVAGSQAAPMALTAAEAAEGAWTAMLEAFEAGRSLGPLADGLTRGWALLGAGRRGEAIETFDEVAATEGLRGFGLYHKALALSVVGDLEAAEEILATPPEDGLPMTRRGAMTRANVLGRMGDRDAALALLEEVFGSHPDPELAQLRAALSSDGPLPAPPVADAREGVAEVNYSLATALRGEMTDGYVLLYAEIARFLAPGNSDAAILAAELYEDLGRYDLATAAYDSVARDDPAFLAAEVGRAEALRRSGRGDRAVEVLGRLAESHPHLPAIPARLGDALRGLERWSDAADAYSRALDLTPDGAQGTWLLHFNRGIMRHMTDDWPAAEADFRAALDLNPDQPAVLNYLGYSMVERGENLEEALSMIERAVAADPENGAIVDSLGWALFRLGRTEEAVPHLERAAALEPVDPIVNEHLGDAYWAAGRELEARFQWHRALSFDPEPEAAEALRRKLEDGLDLASVVVSQPVHIALGDGTGEDG